MKQDLQELVQSVKVPPPHVLSTIPNCETLFYVSVTDVKQLLAEIERLRADAKRLDWLEQHPLPTEVVGGADDGLTAKTWAIGCDPKWTLRETIDTMIAAEAAGGGE